MDKINKPGREINVKFNCDVTVVGGGVGGFCAAIAASRAGADVVLIERSEYVGGVATSGLMCSISNYFTSGKGEIVSYGVPLEFVRRLVKEGGAMENFARAGQPQIPNDPETVKRVMIKMLNEARVKTLYGTVVYDLLTNDEKVEYLVCNGMEETFAIKTKSVVDSTGELTVFKLANAKYDECDEFSTFLFRMNNVDIDKIIDWFEANPKSYNEQADIPTSLEDTVKNWRDYGVFHLPHYSGKSMSMVKEALQSGEFSETFGQHAREMYAMGMFASKANEGVVLINSMAFRGDSFNIKWASECEEEGRLAVKEVSDFLIKYFPGFENAYVIDTAAEVGFRRSRKLHAKYTLTKDDIADAKAFEDAIGQTIEIDGRDSKDRHRFYEAAQIPLSYLISKDVKNVVLGSGKNAGSDTFGLLRGQAGCMTIGQGAGISAALSTIYGFELNNPNEEDMGLIHKELVERQFVKIGELSYD